MPAKLYANVSELKGFSLKSCPPMPLPGGVLMCPPDHYDITEARNPFMAESRGGVHRSQAKAQWEGVRAAFERLGQRVVLMDPAPGLEDMVFTANTALTGLTPRMEKVCLLSRMRYPARRGEVPHMERKLAAEGYRLHHLNDPAFTFEGTGDCLWHPGRRLLWGGCGFRTDPEVYPRVAEIFDASVVLLKLVNERFYHLDTCFCPLNQEAVLIYPPAFAPESLEVILRLFPVVLAVDERESSRMLACNAAVVGERTVLLQKGAEGAVGHLRALGFETLELETGEFLKSGGSVFCMKLWLY